MESQESAAASPPAVGKPNWLSRHESLLILAILVVAAFARLWRLDLMQFRGDEAEACLIAYHALGDQLRDGEHDFPLVGLMASVGVRNPPFFAYVLALPLAWSRSPLVAQLFISLCNVAAVGFSYVLGRRLFSPTVGLAAAALYALSPAAILFSRSIYASGVVPVVGGLFLLSAHAYLVDRRPSALAWMLLTSAVAIQIHYTGIIFLPLLLFSLVAGRAAFRWRWFGCGLVLVGVLYLPYFLYLLNSHGRDFGRWSEHFGLSANPLPAGFRLLLSVWYSFAVSNADTTEFVTGVRWPYVFPIFLSTGVLGLGGLIHACWRARRESRPLFYLQQMMLVWFVLPLLLLSLTGTMPFRHYFTVIYPLPFLGLAVLLESGLRSGRRWGGTLLALILAGYAWFDVSIYHTIAAQGGAPNPNGFGYDIAYAYKNQAMDFILAENRDRPFILSTDFSLEPEVPLEYRILILLKMRETGWAPSTEKPAYGYVLQNTFDLKLSEEGQHAVAAFRQVHFGPLTVYVVPLGK